MSVVPVADVLQGRVAVDSEVTVRGWVRTRRDSKAGFSFLAVYDGSCFDPVQAVINNSLPNYNQEVLRLTTGCSVIVTGKVVASQGQGQSFEIRATSVEVTGWVEDPDTYPMAAKRHSIEYLREVAHLRPRTNLIGAVARVRHTGAGAAPLLQRTGLLLGFHPADHRLRYRRRRRNVPRVDAGSGKPAA